MYEVEVKLRADHDAVRARLDDLGAAHLGVVEQRDTYYDAPHRDFAATDEALRLRTETRLDDGDTVTKMTYKGPLVDDASKSREEFETVLGNPDAGAGILDGLGFEPAAIVEKRRERFELSGMTVTLDAVDGLGEFVEVERAAPPERLAEVRERAFDVLCDLGLDPEDQIRTSYLGLLLESNAQ
ncbi:MAG: class IV adenylate cyclase [Halobacteriota archaeon]